MFTGDWQAATVLFPNVEEQMGRYLWHSRAAKLQ